MISVKDLDTRPPLVGARRALVLVESLARIPRFEWLLGIVDQMGLPRSRLTIHAIVQEDVRDVKKRQLAQYREQMIAALGEGSVVMLVGNGPLEAITGKKGIKQKRGRPFEQDGHIFVPVVQPGASLYDERVVPMIEADVRLFADCVVRGAIPREEKLDYTIVDTRRKFDELLADLRGTVSYDIETGGPNPTFGLNPWQGHFDADKCEWVIDARIISIGFGCRGRQWCLPIHHPEAHTEEDLGLTLAQIFARLDRRMRECYLVAHNAKFDSLWLKIHYGVDWRADFDTMLAHWMVDENQLHGLKLLAQLYFGAPNYDADLDHKRGAGPLGPHCQYLAHDVYYTRALRFKLQKLLDEDPGVKRAFELIVMPIARLFVDIEFRGVLVDVDRFEDAEVHLRNELKGAKKALDAALLKSGIPKAKVEGINWRSPKQIAEILFDDLKIKAIPVPRKAKKGKPGGINERSTAETVLKQLTHPVGVALMKFRGADQMLKMFIDGWRPFLVWHPDGWRLHPSFKLHGTVTGRASCEHPNLQQVPRDSLIRSLIGAALGWQLLEMDLSQIEMRLAAELSGDQTLLGIFDRDEDVHWMTAIKEITRGAGMAREIFDTATAYLDSVKRKVPPKWLAELKWDPGQKLTYATAARLIYLMGPDLCAQLAPVWKELRKKAKAINFGYLFGMWWRKMIVYARDNYGVHLTEQQAQESRKSFFDTYKGLAPWHERQKRYARRHGYVRSLSGAKRRLPVAMSPDDTPERGEALRQAINSPVQRFACELNFMVLLQLVAEFGLEVIWPIGTVHDAILAEVRDEWVERVYGRAHEIMRHPALLDELNIRMRVPIKGDGKIGNWSKGVSIEKWKAAQKEKAKA